jgi:hypothetical protein
MSWLLPSPLPPSPFSKLSLFLSLPMYRPSNKYRYRVIRLRIHYPCVRIILVNNDKGKWLYQTMPAALSSSNVPWFPIGRFWEFAKRIYYNDKSDKYCTRPPCIQYTNVTASHITFFIVQMLFAFY